jgi:hypothetical protein
MLIAPMTGSRELTITQLSKPGELVKEGDIVAQFDTTEESFKLREAEFDLSEAEQMVAQATAESEAREEELNAELIVARGELEQARLESRRNPLLAALVVQQNELVLRDAADRVAKLEKEYPQRKAAARAAVTIQEAALKKGRRHGRHRQTQHRNDDAQSPHRRLRQHRIQHLQQLLLPGDDLPRIPRLGDTIRAGMAVAQIPDFSSWEASVVITEADRGPARPRPARASPCGRPAGQTLSRQGIESGRHLRPPLGAPV